MSWKPIEEAPKDGTEILGKSDEGVFQMWWDTDYPSLGKWRPLSLGYHGCGCCGGDPIEPTEWMPIP